MRKSEEKKSKYEIRNFMYSDIIAIPGDKHL